MKMPVPVRHNKWNLPDWGARTLCNGENFIKLSKCIFSSGLPKSEIQACPIVNLWNRSMSITLTSKINVQVVKMIYNTSELFRFTQLGTLQLRTSRVFDWRRRQPIDHHSNRLGWQFFLLACSSDRLNTARPIGNHRNNFVCSVTGRCCAKIVRIRLHHEYSDRPICRQTCRWTSNRLD